MINMTEEIIEYDPYQKIWYEIIDYYQCRWLPSPKFIYEQTIERVFQHHFFTGITFNLFHLPPIFNNEQKQWMFHYLALHEYGHYHICPFSKSRLIYYKFILEENLGINPNDTNFYIHFFSDLLVNKHFSECYDDYIKVWTLWFQWIYNLFSSLNITNSKLWTIFIRYHEIIWQTYTKCIQIDSKENIIAEKLVHLVKNPLSWEDSLIKITNLILPYREKSKRQNNPCDKETMNQINNQYQSTGNQNSDEESNNNQKQGCPTITKSNEKLDLDLYLTLGDYNQTMFQGIENSKENVDKLNIQNKIFSIIEKINNQEQENSIRSTEESNTVSPAVNLFKKLKIVKNEEEFIRIWFRERSKNLIDYNVISKKYTAELKTQLLPWNYSDRFSDLDFMKTVMSSPYYPYPPYAIKWKKTVGTEGDLSLHPKNALLVIDTSGSMGIFSRCKLQTKFDYAILSAMALLNAIKIKNGKMAVLNFSDHALVQTWNTLDSIQTELFEKIIMYSQGGGTSIPLKELKSLTEKSDEPSYIFVITDSLVSNWETAMPVFKKLIEKHFQISIFVINTENNTVSPEVAMMKNIMTIQIIIIKNISSLPRLILNQYCQ